MVGVIRIGEVTIQILPKLFRDHLTRERRTIARNLLIMLSYSDIPFVSSDITLMEEEDLDMLELFIRIFAERLLRLLSRSQHRLYLQQHKTLRFIKGQIQVQQYWNPAKLDQIPCNYKELTQDTLLNRIFRYCATLMSRHTQNDDTKENLKRILQILEPVTYTQVTASDAKSIILNRLSSQFAPYLRFCEIYLRHSTISLQASHVEVFSLLIPMEKVFEQFIAGVLAENNALIPEGGIVLTQDHAGYLAQTPEGRGVFKLIPDIVIDHPRIPVIIDTKYKLLDEEDSRKGVKQSDMYQMFAYGAKRQVPALMLLYPDSGEKMSVDWEFSFESGRLSALLIRSITLSYDLADPLQWEQWMQELKAIVAELYERASIYTPSHGYESLSMKKDTQSLKT